MSIPLNFSFRVRPPRSFTQGGAASKFQRLTAKRVKEVNYAFGRQIVSELQSQLRSTYNSPGPKFLWKSVKFELETFGQQGSGLKLLVANRPQLPYMTALVQGGNPQLQPYPIVPQQSERLVFFWWRIGKWVSLKQVEHPGFQRDVFADVLGPASREYRQVMVAVYSGSLIELGQ